MASISNDPNGSRRILFTDAKGVRRTLRLGKVSKRHAQATKVRVEDLVSSQLTGHNPSDDTSRWLSGIDDKLYDRLAAVGLVAKRESTTLGAFIDAYIAKRGDVKDSTRLVYQRVRKHLVGFFGEGAALREISEGDAEAWRLHLIGQGLSENTVRRSCGVARQWFGHAVKSRLIATNPITGMSVIVRGNRARAYFVSAQEARLVLAACPDAQWRLMFALARYGGLRCPSEVLRLRWSDINWERNRITVSSPKTEHHDGKGSRVIPIFPELEPYLREAWERAEPGEERCISRYPVSTPNLGPQLTKIVKRAGLTPWPKIWHQLRSTRQTELADSFPAHVVTAWLGNSQAVANEHYLQVTDDHFDKAAQKATQKPAEMPRNDKKSDPSSKSCPTVSSEDFEICPQISTDFEPEIFITNGPYWT
ncbi:MAG: tyrosine-type recombinase/integrase [Phycisphaeraceae bacterium]